MTTVATLAEPLRWLRAGVPVAIGLGVLLLALAGCGQASPSGSGSQVPMVTIVPVAPSVTWGDPLQFRVRAEPAPSADLTAGVTIASPGCKLAQSPTSVTIAAGAPAATLELATTGAEVVGQGCAVTATVAPGEGYAVGSDDSSRSATVVISLGENAGAPPTVAGDVLSSSVPPLVTIDAIVPYVTAGNELQLRLSADRPSTYDYQVLLRWYDPERVLSSGEYTVVWIRTSGKGDDTSIATRADANLGDDNIAQVFVTFEPHPWYTFDDSLQGFLVLGRDASRSLVNIVADPLSVDEGDEVTFTLTADPPPPTPPPPRLPTPLSVNLYWVNGDRFKQTPPRTVAVPSSGNISFKLATKDDLIDNRSDLVGVRVDSGSRYGIGWPATATVTVEDDEHTSVVSVVADSTEVVEGNNLSFTLTADPPPASDLTVNLGWELKGYFFGGTYKPAHTLGATPPDTATIPAKGPSKGTATITVPTINDAVTTLSSTVEVTLLAGVNYLAPHATSRASITIHDND